MKKSKSTPSGNRQGPSQSAKTPKKRRAANINTRSIDAAAQIYADANAPAMDVPAHLGLREFDRPFFNSIIESRARSEWTEVDLLTAVQLARTQRQLVEANQKLDDETSILVGDEGEAMINPLEKLIDILSRRQLALMRALKIGAAGINLTKADLSKRRDAERRARSIKRNIDDLDDDELLAS